MFKKNNRITVAEFKHLGMSVRAFHTPFFSVRIHKIDGEGKKFAVVVSKKIEPTAVGRNRIKRRLYSLLQTHIDNFPTGVAVVLFVKKEAVKATFQSIKDSFDAMYGGR
ncbi:MAG: ribonuclease P protein component [bacterium]|nr:ribonuclease P protein component [bacterium]